MAFPRPNAFELYGSTKLFRQALTPNADGDPCFRTQIDATASAATGAGYIGDSVDTTPVSYEPVDLTSGDPITVSQIIVSNDDTGSAILYVNFNDDATTDTFKLLAGEVFTFDLAEVNGAPITSISVVSDASIPPCNYRIWVFGTV